MAAIAASPAVERSPSGPHRTGRSDPWRSFPRQSRVTAALTPLSLPGVRQVRDDDIGPTRTALGV